MRWHGLCKDPGVNPLTPNLAARLEAATSRAAHPPPARPADSGDQPSFAAHLAARTAAATAAPGKAPDGAPPTAAATTPGTTPGTTTAQAGGRRPKRPADGGPSPADGKALPPVVPATTVPVARATGPGGAIGSADDAEATAPTGATAAPGPASDAGAAARGVVPGEPDTAQAEESAAFGAPELPAAAPTAGRGPDRGAEVRGKATRLANDAPPAAQPAGAEAPRPGPLPPPLPALRQGEPAGRDPALAALLAGAPGGAAADAAAPGAEDAGTPVTGTAAAGLPTGSPAAAAFTMLIGSGAPPASAPPAPPASAPPVTVPIDAPDWGDHLGHSVSWAVDQKLTHAQIALNPQHLGPLEIRLSLVDGTANVAFSTHNAAASQALHASTGQLRDMLGQAGFTQVNVDISQQSGREARQGGGYGEPPAAFRVSAAPVSGPSGVAPRAASVPRSQIDAYA